MKSFERILFGVGEMRYRRIANVRRRVAIRRKRWGNFAQAHGNLKAARISVPCLGIGS